MNGIEMMIANFLQHHGIDLNQILGDGQNLMSNAMNKLNSLDERLANIEKALKIDTDSKLIETKQIIENDNLIAEKLNEHSK